MVAELPEQFPASLVGDDVIYLGSLGNEANLITVLAEGVLFQESLSELAPGVVIVLGAGH